MSGVAAPAPTKRKRRPKAPGERRRAEAETAVRHHLSTIDEMVRRGVRECVDRAHHELLTPLQQVMREAALIHRGLMETAVLSTVDAADQQEFCRHVVAYRLEVAARVLEPIRVQLGSRLLGNAIGAAFLDALRALSLLGEVELNEVQLPVPPALHSPAKGDSFRIRTRKVMQRARKRVARTLRQRPPPGTAAATEAPRERVVPVGRLVAYHLHVRLPRVLAGIQEDSQQHVARYVASVEDAFTRWSHAVLRTEEALDRPDFHRSPPAGSVQSPPAGRPVHELSLWGERDEFQRLASDLQQALESAVEPEVTGVVFDEAPLRGAATALEEDVQLVGTSLLSIRERPLPKPGKGPAASLRARQETWAQWHTQTLNRLALNRHLVELRHELGRIQTMLMDRITQSALTPVFTAFGSLSETLHAAHEWALRVCDDTPEALPAEALANTLGTLQSQTMERLHEILRELPGVVAADQALVWPGQPETELLNDVIRQLPRTLSVHPRQPLGADRVEPGRRPLSIHLRAITEEAITLPLPVRLKEAAQPLRKQVVHVWGGTEQIYDIVQYNLGATLDELDAAITAADDADSAPHEPSPKGAALQAVRELTADGLRRAVNILDELLESLWQPWNAFGDAVFRSFGEDWTEIRQRVQSEDLTEEQWVRFQTGYTFEAGRIWRKTGERWKRLASDTRRYLQIGRTRLPQGAPARRGSHGVARPVESPDAGGALDQADQLPARLPLVYRKLFSMDAVSEASLFEGRSDDLDWMRHHFSRWQETGERGVVVLSGPLGSGRTSLLNAFRNAALRESDVRSLSLDERVDDDARLASLLARILDVRFKSHGSLEELEQRLLKRSRRRGPLVCLIDNLEHLLVQVPGGTDLVERALVFMMRTSRRIYWVATVAGESWRFLDKAAGGRVRFVDTLAMTPIDRDRLEQIILNRHGLSGMSLRFGAPPASTATMRQRLRRAKTRERKQELLRTVYFDRLHELTGQNLRLALFYWLRSADFNTEDDILTVQPVVPLSFSVLSALDMRALLSLKAFLIHNSLSSEEHRRIFRMSEGESMTLLESLRHDRIIERVLRHRGKSAGGGSVPAARYRVHSLALHPLRQYLRARHLIG